MITDALIKLLQVADAFLRRKATIGDLRRAVNAAKKAQGGGKSSPANDHRRVDMEP